MSTERKPFRHGDVCKYVGEDDLWSGRHIIDKLSSSDDPEYWSYSTDRGAWIHHDNFELTAESSMESRAELHQAKIDESGPEEL